MKKYSIEEISDYFRGWSKYEPNPQDVVVTKGSVWNAFMMLEDEQDGIGATTDRARAREGNSKPGDHCLDEVRVWISEAKSDIYNFCNQEVRHISETFDNLLDEWRKLCNLRDELERGINYEKN